MQLEVEGQPIVQNPGPEKIAESLTSLDGQASGFAILSAAGEAFLQASGAGRDGFMVEYKDGKTRIHYECPNAVSLEEVVKIFRSYANGNEDWRNCCNWEILRPSPQKRRRFHKPRFYMDGSKIVALLSFAVIGLSAYCWHTKWARPSICMAVICFSCALFVAAGNVGMQRSGRVMEEFETYTKAGSPVRFWTGNQDTNPSRNI